MYGMLLFGRNLAFTIIDNDKPYLKLLYQLLSSWQEVKDDDNYEKHLEKEHGIYCKRKYR